MQVTCQQRSIAHFMRTLVADFSVFPFERTPTSRTESQMLFEYSACSTLGRVWDLAPHVPAFAGYAGAHIDTCVINTPFEALDVHSNILRLA
jgi:hypothetical protein